MRRMSCEHLEAFLPQGCDGKTKEASTRGKRGWNKGAAKGVRGKGGNGETKRMGKRLQRLSGNTFSVI